MFSRLLNNKRGNVATYVNLATTITIVPVCAIFSLAPYSPKDLPMTLGLYTSLHIGATVVIIAPVVLSAMVVTSLAPVVLGSNEVPPQQGMTNKQIFKKLLKTNVTLGLIGAAGVTCIELFE